MSTPTITNWPVTSDSRLMTAPAGKSAVDQIDTAVSIERLFLDPFGHYDFFCGTREAFDAQYAKLIMRFNPELVARFPQINTVEDVHGYIAGTVIRTTRNQTPFYWVGLPGTRHFHLEYLIKQHGNAEEVQGVMQYRRGFMTNRGRMVSRLSAYGIAKDAGQLLPHADGKNELYSDDIW